MHKLLIAFFKHEYHEVTSMNGGILLVNIICVPSILKPLNNCVYYLRLLEKCVTSRLNIIIITIVLYSVPSRFPTQKRSQPSLGQT